jgi:Zn-dependent peptidase ImmA (M78 family)
MKIPHKIKSQGLWWKVRYNDDIEPLGLTDYDKQEIIIKKSLSPELKQAVFFHELGHTVNTTMDHAFMDSLLMQIFQILKDNNLL